MEQHNRQQTFDNPPKISSNPVVQLERAYKWNVEWKWSKNDACDKSGCSIFRLNNAINAGGPDKVKDAGRPTLLTEPVITEVLRKMTTGALRIESISLEPGAPNSLYTVIMDAIKAEQNNPHAAAPKVDWKTKKDWAKIILARGNCVSRIGEIKAKGRKKAYIDLRNRVAYAATIRCLFVHRSVNPELLASTDDVSILVHRTMSDKKPILLAPKTALKWLQENGIGLSMSAQEIYKQRMITFKITITRSKAICIVIILYDKKLEEYKNAPAVYSMGECIYVVLAHPSIDQKVLEYYIECACIEKEIDKYRYINNQDRITMTFTTSY